MASIWNNHNIFEWGKHSISTKLARLCFGEFNEPIPLEVLGIKKDEDVSPLLDAEERELVGG
eukprot:4788735-Prorocentrum_lima.AAC.1